VGPFLLCRDGERRLLRWGANGQCMSARFVSARIGVARGYDRIARLLTSEANMQVYQSSFLSGISSLTITTCGAVSTPKVASQKPGWETVVKELQCSSAKDLATCVASASTQALAQANLNSGAFGWSITVDGVDLLAPGPVLASQGKPNP
jgi:hypothetical protein